MEATLQTHDLAQFTENVDSWIKQVRSEVSQITDTSAIVEENSDNVQHNYELIYELKRDMERISDELKALKLMHLLQIKGDLAKQNKVQFSPLILNATRFLLEQKLSVLHDWFIIDEEGSFFSQIFNHVPV